MNPFTKLDCVYMTLEPGVEQRFFEYDHAGPNVHTDFYDPAITVVTKRGENDVVKGARAGGTNEDVQQPMLQDSIELVPDKSLVFVHVPKCGGTTIDRWLRQIVRRGLVSKERRRLPLDLATEQRLRLRRCRVFSGHFDVLDLRHFPKPHLRFTVLRDPTERLVSLCDFWRSRDPEHTRQNDLRGPLIAQQTTFEEFVSDGHGEIRHAIDNEFVRRFTKHGRSDAPIPNRNAALTAACRNLGEFDHVGHLRHLDRTAEWLVEQLGAPAEALELIRPLNVRGAYVGPHGQDAERTSVSARARELMRPIVELDDELVRRFSP